MPHPCDCVHDKIFSEEESTAEALFTTILPDYIVGLPRNIKQLLVLVVDVVFCMLTTWLVMSLRLETPVPLNLAYWIAAGTSLLIIVPLFIHTGLYRAIFRHSGFNALTILGRVMAMYSLLYMIIFALFSVPGVPRSVGVFQPLMLLVLVAASRLIARVWLDGTHRMARQHADRVRVLIYGAGAAGRQLTAAMHRSEKHQVVGYLDDDQRLHSHTLDGLRVYDPFEMETCLDKVEADEVLLALPSASRQRRAEIFETLSRLSVQVRTIPALADLASGKVELSDVRPLEIDDLLGRDPVPPTTPLLNRDTRSKVVMVTGAGGSIGSELCRQILACQPERLLLVENSEHGLYQIHRELDHAGCEVVPLLASVLDERRMREIMATWRPHTVYHAAAYKHVPLVEHNAAQGVLNNVWGTWVCAEAAIDNGVRHFVLISTDKAVRPTNIMGASKRLAEMVLQGLADDGGESPERICFAIVRFGNVLGSSGSVVPLFREQIGKGGPITLTHPEITRYFMTIPEAAQLVIQAGAMACGGDVFVLDMGEPVRISELARRMVELSGLTVKDAGNPQGDIEIRMTGLRPGEKLYEELLIGDDPQTTKHPRIMKAHEDFIPLSELKQALSELHYSLQANDIQAVKHHLTSLVKGYKPADAVVDWVWVEQKRRFNSKTVNS